MFADAVEAIWTSRNDYERRAHDVGTALYYLHLADPDSHVYTAHYRYPVDAGSMVRVPALVYLR